MYVFNYTELSCGSSTIVTFLETIKIKYVSVLMINRAGSREYAPYLTVYNVRLCGEYKYLMLFYYTTEKKEWRVMIAEIDFSTHIKDGH